ncbi:MAG TPA: 2Fe-2S iron-sulfur cluster-binding protein [Negativicutes bacterium]|nr:2Fe-2S iron-sulfur cluster-binding protein [Negativicutes bacterium]
MIESESVIYIQALRFDPDHQGESRFQSYEVATMEALSVMALLVKIHEMDASFACRTSTCFKGQCGSCLIRMNGQDVLGCVTLVRPGESVVLEPHSKFRVIRDMVVDFLQPKEDGNDIAKM